MSSSKKKSVSYPVIGGIVGLAALAATPKLLAEEPSCEDTYNACMDSAFDAYSSCSADCMDLPTPQQQADCDSGCFDTFFDEEVGCFNAWINCC